MKNKSWWNYLSEDQQDLLEESAVLLEREEQHGPDIFHDYAFIVFPAAKAYEGFLKKLFLDLGFIGLEQYEGDHFRIGKALNPSLPARFQNEDWAWEKLANFCQGEELPQLLWDTWKESRNLIFHWFPKHENFISLFEAKDRINMIVEAIDRSFLKCKFVTS